MTACNGVWQQPAWGFCLAPLQGAILFPSFPGTGLVELAQSLATFWDAFGMEFDWQWKGGQVASMTDRNRNTVTEQLDAGGIPAISRGLSVAIPPETKNLSSPGGVTATCACIWTSRPTFPTSLRKHRAGKGLDLRGSQHAQQRGLQKLQTDVGVVMPGRGHHLTRQHGLRPHIQRGHEAPYLKG